MPRLRGTIGLVTPMVACGFLCGYSMKAMAFSDFQDRALIAQNIVEINQPTVKETDDLLELVADYNEQELMSQVNEVDLLRDVSPQDWAFEALVSLIERYHCVSGFPNQTYRGKQPVSRYEFAAGLNSCLNEREKAIANSDEVSREEIDTLLRLMQEFQAELAILRGKTDGIQARIGELEATQFSNTTKLTGEVVFGLSTPITDNSDLVTVFGDRVRLELNNSFFGGDLLFTRLSTGNFPTFATQTRTFQGNLAFSQPESNDLAVEVLFYTLPLGDRGNLIFGTTGIAADDIVNTVNILDGDGATGAISTFGTRNPIYYPPGDAGVGINYTLEDNLDIAAGYLGGTANESSEGNGLFNGSYSAIASVLFTPYDSLNLGFTYVHGYNQSDTGTGSQTANLQSLTASNFNKAVPTISNAYGVEVSWSISDRFILGGWGGFSQVTTLSSLQQQIDRGTQDIWNWAVTLALPDLGKEGNLGGVIVGQEPTVTDSSINNFPKDQDTSFHVEAFYQYQLTDEIAITPGVVWISPPDNNSNHEDLVIGTVRTTFSF